MVAARGIAISQISLPSPLQYSPVLSLQQRCQGFPSSLSSSGTRYRFPSSRCLKFSLLTPPTRVDVSCWKCSISDADLQITDVSSHDEEGGASYSISACSSSIIHLKSDILEANPLNLLSERSCVDRVLTSLPVLTEEEQNTLAATPAHPAGLYALYANCLAGNLVEQLWNFAWPAAIALIRPSLLPVAVMSFFTKLIVIIGGPMVGKFMDFMPRVPCYNCLSLIQVSAQLLSVAMIIHGHSLPSSTISCFLLRPWFLTLVLAGAVERLTGLALGVAMERDWVVLVMHIPLVFL